MSVSFFSDAAFRTWATREPCLCAQGAPSFAEALLGGVTPAVEGDLPVDASPDCPWCDGTGVEEVEQDDAPVLCWSNDNALVLLRVLEVEAARDGLTLAEARRAVMRARSCRDLSVFARGDEVVHSQPRDLGDGIVELHPVRGWSRGLDADDIWARVEAFAEFVEEVGRRGGTRIWWG